MGLEKVAIGIKTFLRDSALFNTISAIRDTMPEVQMIIADDGEMTEEKRELYENLRTLGGHKVIFCDFDSGFGYKSNVIIDVLDRPYLLVGSDDFDFRPPSVRTGIEKMLEVLENTDIDVAGGRVFGPYEFDLEENDGVVREIPVNANLNPMPWYIRCDLTVNYTLMKRRIFEKVRWDDDVKIGGGEHGAQFIKMKRAGFKVAWVPGVEIREQQTVNSSWYQSYRARSGGRARPCFDRIGVRKYVLGNGTVDYERK